MPVDPEVRGICARAMAHFETMGVAVEEHAPDFSGAMEAFHTFRAVLFVTDHAERMKAHRDKFKPEILWNYDKGQALTAADIARAEGIRAALFQRMADFFAEFDLLACPTAAVPPYSLEQRYVDRIGDTVFDNYVDWMGLQCAVTVTSSPAISIPCGFTSDGRPVGLQLVARPRGEAELLQAAALFEAGGRPPQPAAHRPAGPRFLSVGPGLHPALRSGNARSRRPSIRGSAATRDEEVPETPFLPLPSPWRHLSSPYQGWQLRHCSAGRRSAS